MLNLSFRRAKLKDLGFIWKVENECFNSIDVFKKNQLYHFLRNPNKSIISDIIISDNTPVGWACFFTKKNQKSIRLYSLCISPAHRGRGIAREYLVDRLNGLGGLYNKVYLEVRKSNIKAIKLYTSLGFRKQRELPGYYLNEDGIKMICRLPLDS